MKLEPATQAEVYEVAVSMRDQDWREFSAIRFEETRAEMAAALAAAYGGREDVLCVRAADGDAVAIGGFIMGRPNVVSLLLFATDALPKVGLPLTRFIRRFLFPALEARGVHRIEAVSLASYTETHDWMATLGLQPETPPMLNYGRDGQAFIQFARINARPSGA